MYSSGAQKLSEIYSTPKSELPDDDLSFLRTMIEKPPPPTDPIDFDFLKNELAKRRPPPKPRKTGIELIEPQVKPSAYTPKFLKTSIAAPSFAERRVPPPAEELVVQMEPENEKEMERNQSDLMIRSKEETQETQNFDESEKSAKRTPPKIKTPKKYVSWKYIGELDGELGVLSGKIDPQEEKKNGRNISKDFANLPYLTNNYKRPAPPPPAKKPKVRPRDLFKLSIASDSREAAKQRSISAMRRERKFLDEFDSNQNDTQLFIQTDTELIPLCVSYLKQH